MEKLTCNIKCNNFYFMYIKQQFSSTCFKSIWCRGSLFGYHNYIHSATIWDKPKYLPPSQNGTDTSSSNLDHTDSGSWQSQRNNDPHVLRLIFNTASIKRQTPTVWQANTLCSSSAMVPWNSLPCFWKPYHLCIVPEISTTTRLQS